MSDIDVDLAAPAGLTENRLLDGRVTVLQPTKGFRAAIDPVLLAAAVAAPCGARVLDAGTGIGTAGLCLTARLPSVTLVGLERDPAIAALARRNAALNQVTDRFAVVTGDILDAEPPAIGDGFDWAMANPPHLQAGTYSRSADPGRDAAMGEDRATLADWIGFLWARLRPGGTAVIVHRADRIDSLLTLMEPRFGEITLFPLWPRLDQPAKRVIVAGRRDSRGPARLAFGLVLHESDGRFTDRAEAVLRSASPLPLSA